MPDAADPTSVFYRAGERHRFTARQVAVSAVERLHDRYARISLSGPDLADFISSGPADHVRVFFPDPVTGALVAPTPAGGDEGGVIRPAAPTFARDFTPLHVGDAAGERSFQIDVLLHEDPGPSARWAARARIDDRLVVVGPNASRSATRNAPRVLCVVDESALPAASRWLTDVPASTRVDVVADITGDLGWVPTYLTGDGGRGVTVTAAGDDLVAAVRASAIDAGTFLFVAGEASRLVALRRYLRRELALAPEQFSLSGYWKRGTTAFDHHAPIDHEE